MNDRGRAEVYAAEIAAFDGTVYEAFMPLDQLIDLAASITSAPWWPHGQVPIVPSRRDAHSSAATADHRGSQIRLAAPQHTPVTLIHELAHVLAGTTHGHGPAFRRAYLDLVGSAFGVDEAHWLECEFGNRRLAVGDRSWPSPPPRHGPIAL